MKSKKKLGIVGGMGSVAAVYFFRRLVELTPAHSDQDYIETFIHNNTSIPDRTQGILYGGPSPLPELKRSLSILNDMGADYIVFACMTSHYFIPDLQESSRAILIDGIADTAAYMEGKLNNVRRAGILASTGALRSGIFQKALAKVDIEAIVLDDDDQEKYFMQPIYEPWGIKVGNIGARPRKRLEQGAQILVDNGADAVIAGCSELPLVLKQERLDFPLVDTIDVLLISAIDRCLGCDESDITNLLIGRCQEHS